MEASLEELAQPFELNAAGTAGLHVEGSRE